MLRLHNPHSVLATLESRPKDVSEIIVPAGGSAREDRGRGLGEGWDRVVKLAKEKNVRVTTAAPKSQSDRGRPGGPRGGERGGEGGRDRDRSDSDGRTGVAEAVIQERNPISVEELFEDAREKADGKGLWLALDSLQDPHNVGAIFRTAAFFGVQGILLTQERSAPLTSTVYDVASGGMESIPFAIEVNLQRSFEKAKDAGLWILGTSEHAKADLSTVERDRPWLLVIGNEEKGMRRLTEEACDVLCKVTPAGNVTSLNASVAAAIFISKLTGRV
jgi:23S rRNA (guanosine2251-2'-O)-methyltransferase